MKSKEIDVRITNILENIMNPQDGYTTIEITKLVFGDEQNYMSKEEFTRACGRVGRRMGSIRHDKYHLMDEEDIKPKFLPFALPVQDGERRIWKYFNGANHPHIDKVIENLFSKSVGLESRAKLLKKVYQ